MTSLFDFSVDAFRPAATTATAELTNTNYSPTSSTATSMTSDQFGWPSAPTAHLHRATPTGSHSSDDSDDAVRKGTPQQQQQQRRAARDAMLADVTNMENAAPPSAATTRGSSGAHAQHSTPHKQVVSCAGGTVIHDESPSMRIVRGVLDAIDDTPEGKVAAKQALQLLQREQREQHQQMQQQMQEQHAAMGDHHQYAQQRHGGGPYSAAPLSYPSHHPQQQQQPHSSRPQQHHAHHPLMVQQMQQQQPPLSHVQPHHAQHAQHASDQRAAAGYPNVAIDYPQVTRAPHLSLSRRPHVSSTREFNTAMELPPTRHLPGHLFTLVVVVEFKLDRRVRVRATADFQSAQGSYVVVELDHGMGLDCGIAIGVFPYHMRSTIPREWETSTTPVGRAIRLADDADCAIINTELPQIESRALDRAHSLVHFLHMPFDIIDCECQFDRRAVKVFYSVLAQAKSTIVPNVSRLQRELGFHLKAKVFLEQLVPMDEASPRPPANASSASASAAVQQQHQAGAVQQQYLQRQQQRLMTHHQPQLRSALPLTDSDDEMS